MSLTNYACKDTWLPVSCPFQKAFIVTQVQCIQKSNWLLKTSSTTWPICPLCCFKRAEAPPMSRVPCDLCEGNDHPIACSASECGTERLLSKTCFWPAVYHCSVQKALDWHIGILFLPITHHFQANENYIICNQVRHHSSDVQTRLSLLGNRQPGYG